MKTTLNALHHQDKDWKRELDFYIEELSILTKRLDEVGKSNSSKDILARVDQFLNKFVILREQTDTLKHDIQLREDWVENMAKLKPTHVDERMGIAGDKILNNMRNLATSLADTRYEFNRFLSEVL